MNKSKLWELSEQLDKVIDIMTISQDNGNLDKDFLKFKALFEALAIAIRCELKGKPYSLSDYYAVKELLEGGEE